MNQQKLLSHDQAKRYYDRLGAMLDHQGFYEDPPVHDLVAHLALRSCHSMAEFGCGTGRLAEELLSRLLPNDARYFGMDVSDTMVALARNRLAKFGQRAEIVQSDGAIRIDRPDGAFDCLISTFVLDLLSDDDIHDFLKKAHRTLKTGGQLGLVSLTNGQAGLSRFVSAVWSGLHRISPWIVGGCRPIQIPAYLGKDQWRIDYTNSVAPFGMASEIVVARRI